MTTLLTLLDASTDGVIEFTEISQLATEIAAHTSPSRNIKAFLPIAAVTDDYLTPTSEAALLAVRASLHTEEEVLEMQTATAKPERDLTPAERASFAQPGAQVSHYTKDNISVVDYSVPIFAANEEVLRLEQGIDALLAFLHRGKAEGALLQNSDYVLPEETQAEQAAPVVEGDSEEPEEASEPVEAS